MQDRYIYEYAIIRFSPLVERGEFFNIGAILYSKPKKFIAMRFHIDEAKLSAFKSEHTKEELENYLKAWEDICNAQPKNNAIAQMEMPNRFRWLVATRSTIIQSSPTHTGVCENPEKELEDIFERFVL
ncbi:DUF3037 domain-containing protein [Brumimicrobium oceani]|uniref:DUF3037 domain-containing protein n=1 Tax=Brumimicrobium oceani TaxID=2100725 RepID=A0A2U2XFN9_9FLAO|nr:DUF3037 domain-containing protein [Brumimicrobium oceani]PWH86619.1 DUF3037 domain-containing protein [Brumimicrobium oceani]